MLLLLFWFYYTYILKYMSCSAYPWLLDRAVNAHIMKSIVMRILRAYEKEKYPNHITFSQNITSHHFYVNV